MDHPSLLGLVRLTGRCGVTTAVPAALEATIVTSGPGMRRRSGACGPGLGGAVPARPARLLGLGGARRAVPAPARPARLLGVRVFVGGLEAGDFGVEVGQHGPDGSHPRAQLSRRQACRVLRQLVNCADDPSDRPALDRTHARILAGAGDRTRRDQVNLSRALGRGGVGSAAVPGTRIEGRTGTPRAKPIKYRFSVPVVTSVDRLSTGGYRYGAAEPVDNSGYGRWILGTNLFSTHRACAVF